MKDQTDWISSLSYGGVAELDETPEHHNLESLLSEIRAVGEVEHSFRVIQIGRAMLRRPPPTMATLQLVLRDFYFNYRRYGSPAMIAEHLVTVSSRGVFFTSRDPSGELDKINSTHYGPHSLLQATAVRFATKCDHSQKSAAPKKVPPQAPAAFKPKLLRAHQALLTALSHLTNKRRQGHSRVVSGRFAPLDRYKSAAVMTTDDIYSAEQTSAADVVARDQAPWFLISHDYEFLSQLYHPPVVAFILRRQNRIRSIDLHVFVCCSDSDATQLVTFVRTLIDRVSRLHAPDGCSSGHLEKAPSPVKARNAPINSPFPEEGSYYERLIVKEAIGTSATSQPPTVPFVNPNVALSDTGTLTSMSFSERRSLNKLATPCVFAPAGSSNISSNEPIDEEKPTIFEVVDAEPFASLELRESPKKQESEYNEECYGGSEGVVEAVAELECIEPRMPQYPEDGYWSRSEIPPSILPRPVKLAATSYVASDKAGHADYMLKTLMLGDVQSLLGYLP